MDPASIPDTFERKYLRITRPYEFLSSKSVINDNGDSPEQYSGVMIKGAGIDPNVDIASFKALLCALNRASMKGAT